MTVSKIGKAEDVQAIIDLMGEIDPDEMLVVYRRRNEEGRVEWSYDHTRLDSKFNMIGVLHWVQTALAETE